MRVIFFTRRAGLSWTQGMCHTLNADFFQRQERADAPLIP